HPIMLIPGSFYVGSFNTQNSAGAATNADALPTASLLRNGVADGAAPLTVVARSTGSYKVTGTIPAGYAASDTIEVEVSATVGGVAGKCIITKAVLDSALVGDVY